MNINGISQNPLYPTPNTTNSRGSEKADGGFTGAVEKMNASGKTQAAGATQSSGMDAFKKDIYEQISAMRGNSSTSFSVTITDGAFERMKNDPKFKDDMMGMIRKEFAAARPPITSSMTTIDTNGYSGQSFNFGYGTDRLKNHEEKSFYKRPSTEVKKELDKKAKLRDEQYSEWLKEQMMMQSDASRKALRDALANKDAQDELI